MEEAATWGCVVFVMAPCVLFWVLVIAFFVGVMQ